MGTSILERDDLQVPKARQDTMFPRFLQDVLVRGRRWKKQAFDPTVESAKYLGPAREDNGHWIKVEYEAPRVTGCFMQKALERPDEGVWLAVEREALDALTKRRRPRGKTTVRQLKMREDGENPSKLVCTKQPEKGEAERRSAGPSVETTNSRKAKTTSVLELMLRHCVS